jgi:hypothetical protein
MEVREDELNMIVLNGNQLLAMCEKKERSRVNKRVLHYYWNNDNLMFKGLVVPRPNEQ